VKVFVHPLTDVRKKVDFHEIGQQKSGPRNESITIGKPERKTKGSLGMQIIIDGREDRGYRVVIVNVKGKKRCIYDWCCCTRGKTDNTTLAGAIGYALDLAKLVKHVTGVEIKPLIRADAVEPHLVSQLSNHPRFYAMGSLLRNDGMY
jgi:hypothetical protein